jgi:hypothetical protein
MSCRVLKPLSRKRFPRLLAPVDQDRRAAKTQVSPLVVNRIYFAQDLGLGSTGQQNPLKALLSKEFKL